MKPTHKKVGIIFSGGPAPSANSVISTTAINYLENKIPVIGIFYGYEFIQNFDKDNPVITRDIHYTEIGYEITRVRNERGVYLKTSRANPGNDIKTREDLTNLKKNERLRNIIDAFDYLEIGALISIGGDDTLKTANFLHLSGFPVIHIPKTIDNDYYGIPWTFGYWTAVDTAQKIMLNIKADAQATNSYYIVELMGRKTGWITYAAGIASEAIMMISAEDIEEDTLNVDVIANEIVNTIIDREEHKRPYGVIAISEGLVDKLPIGLIPKTTDRHGNIQLGKANIARFMAFRVGEIYSERTGSEIKITSKQIGYETRAAAPISFDVVLAGMLGYGAYRFYSENMFGVMVSVTDNFNLKAVPFDELIDSNTLKTRIRGVPKGSDFYALKERLSFRRFI
ncbi:MAG: 6-phosphofructokinase [Spirochaetota bacterium]|nr:6-phosphofructokinase [Spirochaetota bacterium]